MSIQVQQITCEQTILKRATKEQETKANLLSAQLSEIKKKCREENEKLTQELEDKNKLIEVLTQDVSDQKGENVVIKRKLELSLRVSIFLLGETFLVNKCIQEVSKELNQCRKKLDHYENNNSSSDSSISLNGVQRNGEASPSDKVDHVKVTANVLLVIIHETKGVL